MLEFGIHNELRIDAAEGRKAKEGLKEPPYQSELD